MDLDYMEKCLDALKNWPRPVPYGQPRSLIGIIGGEPIMHPQFDEMFKTAPLFGEIIPENLTFVG